MNKTIIATIVIILVIIVGGIVFFSVSFNQSEQQQGIVIKVEDSNGANEISNQEYTDIQTDEDIFRAIDDTLNYIE